MSYALSVDRVGQKAWTVWYRAPCKYRRATPGCKPGEWIEFHTGHAIPPRGLVDWASVF